MHHEQAESNLVALGFLGEQVCLSVVGQAQGLLGQLKIFLSQIKLEGLSSSDGLHSMALGIPAKHNQLHDSF